MVNKQAPTRLIIATQNGEDILTSTIENTAFDELDPECLLLKDCMHVTITFIIQDENRRQKLDIFMQRIICAKNKTNNSYEFHVISSSLKRVIGFVSNVIKWSEDTVYLWHATGNHDEENLTVLGLDLGHD